MMCPLSNTHCTISTKTASPENSLGLKTIVSMMHSLIWNSHLSGNKKLHEIETKNSFKALKRKDIFIKVKAATMGEIGSYWAKYPSQ